MKCVTNAWDLHESELRQFLYSRLRNLDQTEDLLQDVFLKALREGSRFCAVDNTRAWLFRVTRNALIDFLRIHKQYDEMPDDLAQEVEVIEPVVNLSQCLPTALEMMMQEDREIIEFCDLEGMNQQQYAELKGLSLPGAKSRIQRARKRLKQQFHAACKVKFDEHGRVCCFDPSCY